MQRFCKVCRQFHSMDEPWPDECNGHWNSRGQSIGLQIMKDIDPYQAVAVDIATGKRPNIGSRSDHRAFLKRNDYVEVGNEKPKPKAWDYGQEVSPRDVKNVIDQLRSRR